MYISYSLNGRFGNNLFQYLATKILQHTLSSHNLIYTYSFNFKDNNSFIIKEDDYIYFLNNIHENIHKIQNKNIYLDGYFQYDHHIRKHIDYVSSIFVNTNIERINHQYTISDITSHIDSYKQKINLDNLTNTLFIHVRLDDFIPEKVCMKVGSYLKILETIFTEYTFKNVIIVVDQLKYKFEADYLQLLYMYLKSKQLNVEVQQDTMMTDFSKLICAPYLLSSNSTFCYLAGLLGIHIKSWCPINTRYPHQDIKKFNENTVSFDIEYV